MKFRALDCNGGAGREGHHRMTERRMASRIRNGKEHSLMTPMNRQVSESYATTTSPSTRMLVSI